MSVLTRVDGDPPLPAALDAISRFEVAEAALWRRHRLVVAPRFVDLPPLGVRVRIMEVGEGPSVLFLPGLGMVGSFWAPLMAELGGYRRIAVDRPGCGLSDPVDFTRLELRSFLTTFASALVDALGLGRVSVVGNSIGGTTALWLAQARPEAVERFVLIGAPPFVLDKNAPLSMRLMSIPFITRKALAGSSAADVDNVFLRMGHHAGTLNPDLTELAAAARALPGYADGFGGLLRGATGVVGRHVAAPAAELARIAQPTLMIWGRNDTHGPVATGRQMARIMPNARLEVCGEGHMPWLDEPERCGGLIRDFLAAGRGAVSVPA
jgi:2-hydroxy-6-oxonona-2,4-dienedioate hydrolase